jgi:hypothetical protein
MPRWVIHVNPKVDRSHGEASQAPVLASVNAAFAGLASIRAFGAQALFTEQSGGRIDEYTRISISFSNLNRYDTRDARPHGAHRLFKMDRGSHPGWCLPLMDENRH